MLQAFRWLAFSAVAAFVFSVPVRSQEQLNSSSITPIFGLRSLTSRPAPARLDALPYRIQ